MSPEKAKRDPGPVTAWVWLDRAAVVVAVVGAVVAAISGYATYNAASVVQARDVASMLDRVGHLENRASVLENKDSGRAVFEQQIDTRLKDVSTKVDAILNHLINENQGR